jgi:hypothetical protein
MEEAEMSIRQISCFVDEHSGRAIRRTTGTRAYER